MLNKFKGGFYLNCLWISKSCVDLGQAINVGRLGFLEVPSKNATKVYQVCLSHFMLLGILVHIYFRRVIK